MKSLRQLGNQPVSLPLLADDVLETHAARILLLLKICGTKGEIDGLTKLAKLDFFVRYPQFFAKVAKHLNKPLAVPSETTESVMVRHHYGPWDKRYYQVLPYLEARGLIQVRQQGNAYVFCLRDDGKRAAEELQKKSEFRTMTDQMKLVKGLVGRKSGTALKELVYEVFDAEVAQKQLGEVIQ